MQTYVFVFGLEGFFYAITYLMAPCSVPNFSWDVSLKEFAHPAVEIFSAMDSIGPTFFLATAMFGFVLQFSSLVTEKELKLRQVFISPKSFSNMNLFH